MMAVGGTFGLLATRRRGYQKPWQQVLGFVTGMLCWAFGLLVLIALVALGTFLLDRRHTHRVVP